MSKLLQVLGIILAAIGFALGIKTIMSPGAMNLYGLTVDTAAILLVGGILSLGIGSLIARLGEMGWNMGVAEGATGKALASVVTETAAVAAKADENHTDIFADSTPYVAPPPPPPVADKLPERVFGSIRSLGGEGDEDKSIATPERSSFRLPSFPRRTGFGAPVVNTETTEATASDVPDVTPIEVPETPVVPVPPPATITRTSFSRPNVDSVIAAAPPPPPPAPPPPAPMVQRSAAEEALARVPVGVTITQRRMIDNTDRHRLPGVIVRTSETAVPAAAAATIGAVTTSYASTSRSVAETLDVLEQAKTEIRTAFDRGESSKTETVVEDDYVEDDVVEGDSDGELYVVEEVEVRGHPARLLSDGTVEAETDEGWMRFENMEHLNEYLDAA